jgi:LytS/YehU family sensor histidine kinase
MSPALAVRFAPMALQNPNRFVAWLKRVEARGDAWAAKRLSADEYAEAMVLDTHLKRRWKRWLFTYLLLATAGTVALATLTTKLGWARSFIVANLLCFGLLVIAASAWYGHRKYTGPKARRTYTVFLFSLFAGGAVGAIVASMDVGTPITEMSAHKLGTILASVTAVSVLLIAFVSAIAFLRGREAAQRMALLQSQAERERLTRQGVQAELKLLQAQVEPHFLFNTLANLRFLVTTDSAQALSMLDHLIHYLRVALPEIRAESSTLGREVELARAYLEIMRIRMGGALEISTDVPPELAGVAFPPLVVLTLVENAIKHGIAPLGRGRVSVRAESAHGRLRVIVEDDGRGLVEPIGQGVGLGNVRERLRALYGETARLDLSGRTGGGTVASVEVPL